MNKPFEKYLRLLLDLNVLMATGRGDEHEADVIRDQMDKPYWKISNVERDLIDKISEALYGN
jgi:hypothetical protein